MGGGGSGEGDYFLEPSHLKLTGMRGGRGEGGVEIVFRLIRVQIPPLGGI